MKKVVEKVQRENEQLKKASGILTSEKMANIELENEKLKVIFFNVIVCMARFYYYNFYFSKEDFKCTI